MELYSYFNEFLKNIRLTPNQANDLITGHNTLRKRLNEDEELSKIIVTMFLQGSYSRFTAVRPKGEDRSDVDVIVVTNLNTVDYSPKKAMDEFKPFFDKYYEDKYEIQRRSFGIELSYVDLDVVITVAPSEIEKQEEDILIKMEKLYDLSPQNMLMELDNSVVKSKFQDTLALKQDSPEWKKVPLCLPDREANEWMRTHPLEQIRWTIAKNSSTNGHYVNIVKALKWWRKEKYPDVKHPKSYPLEHFIGDCCPDDIFSIDEGITRTLEEIVDNHKSKPYLEDRGVPEHDVFEGLTNEDYDRFYSQVFDAAEIARKALDSEDKKESIAKWRELFGSKFPESLQENKKSLYKGTKKTKPSGGRFA